jgi:hypothetical protein
MVAAQRLQCSSDGSDSGSTVALAVAAAAQDAVISIQVEEGFWVFFYHGFRCFP